MSVFVSSNVWDYCQMESDKLLLMLALADYCSDEGICWPSQESLARRTRCTERGVRKMLDVLVECGEIEIVDKGNGRGNCTIYSLTPYKKKEERGAERRNVVQERRNVETERVQALSVKCSGTIEPSIEPSIGDARSPIQSQFPGFQKRKTKRIKSILYPTEEVICDYAHEKGYSRKLGKIFYLKHRSNKFKIAGGRPIQDLKARFDYEIEMGWIKDPEKQDQY